MSYLTFTELRNDEKKTQTFAVINTKHQCELGRIQWYSGWRRYVFMPHDDTLYDSNCLTEIVHFITKLMEDRKQ